MIYGRRKKEEGRRKNLTLSGLTHATPLKTSYVGKNGYTHTGFGIRA
ncbi:MAG: hypothetical protein F6K39_20350 [Okeania sp. SIO3B3]|nr:hypothetical protein [Okeania sp. SIO3B3]